MKERKAAKWLAFGLSVVLLCTSLNTAAFASSVPAKEDVGGKTVGGDETGDEDPGLREDGDLPAGEEEIPEEESTEEGDVSGGDLPMGGGNVSDGDALIQVAAGGAPAPVLKVTFDDSTCSDTSGNQIGSTLVGSPTYGEGKVGQAIHIVNSESGQTGAAEQYVKFDSNENLNFGTGNFSILFWYKRGASSKETAILSNANWDSPSNTGFNIGDYEDSSSPLGVGLQVVFCADGGIRDIVPNQPRCAAAAQEDWHHVALVVDRSAGMTLYVDAVQDSATSFNAANAGKTIDSGNPLVMGADGNLQYGLADGWIDELQVYKEALTVEQIREITGIEVAVKPSVDPDQPVLWVDFEDNVQDKSGRDNHGSLVRNGSFQDCYVEDGKVGKAIHIRNANEGTGSPATNYVDFGRPEDLQFGTEDFSILFWYKSDHSSGWADTAVVSSKNWTTGDLQGFAIGDYSDGMTLNFTPAGASRLDTEHRNETAKNEWHYVAAVFDRSGDMTFYVDTAPLASCDISMTAGKTIDMGGNFVLGADGVHNWGLYDAYIDELKVYRKALTVEEIKAAAGIPIVSLYAYTPEGYDGISKGAPVTVSSDSADAAQGWGKDFLTDWNLSGSGKANGWRTEVAGTENEPATVTIDLQNVFYIKKIALFANSQESNGKGFPVDFTLSVSKDNQTFDEVKKESSYQGSGEPYVFEFPELKDARYVRLTVSKRDASKQVALEEIAVWGTAPLSFSSKYLLMAPGETKKVEVLGDQAENPELQWKSDNEGVAAVSDGVVTAVADGETDIHAFVPSQSMDSSIHVVVESEQFSFDDNIVMVAYWPPVPGIIGDDDAAWDKQYQYLADAGIDLVHGMDAGGLGKPETQKRMIEYSYKYGMVADVADSRFGARLRNLSPEQIGDLVAEYRDLPGCVGYNIVDETNVPNDFIGVYKALKDADPTSYGYLAIMPAFTSPGGAAGYQNYVRDWARLCEGIGYPLDYLMFDLYPYPKTGEMNRKDYLDELAIFWQTGKESGVKTACYLQSTEWNGARLPSNPEIRYEAMMGLAFGFKMFSYFTWFCPGDRGAEVFTHAIVDTNGEPNEPTYSGVKELNQDIHGIGKTLVHLDAEEVYLNGELWGNSYVKNIPQDFFVQPVSSNNYTVSFLRDKETGRNYLMVVNNDYENQQTVVLKPDSSITGFETVSKDDSSLSPKALNAEGNLELTLDAGDGELLALPEGIDFYKDPVTEQQPGENLALNAYVTASSSQATFDASNDNFIYDLTDGVTQPEGKNATWASVGGVTRADITVDLGASRKFNKIVLYGDNALPKDFEILVSEDGKTFSQATSVTGFSTGGEDNKVVFGVQHARYVRLAMSSSNGTYLAVREVEVYLDEVEEAKETAEAKLQEMKTLRDKASVATDGLDEAIRALEEALEKLGRGEEVSAEELNELLAAMDTAGQEVAKRQEVYDAAEALLEEAKAFLSQADIPADELAGEIRNLEELLEKAKTEEDVKDALAAQAEELSAALEKAQGEQEEMEKKLEDAKASAKVKLQEMKSLRDKASVATDGLDEAIRALEEAMEKLEEGQDVPIEDSIEELSELTEELDTAGQEVAKRQETYDAAEELLEEAKALLGQVDVPTEELTEQIQKLEELLEKAKTAEDVKDALADQTQQLVDAVAKVQEAQEEKDKNSGAGNQEPDTPQPDNNSPAAVEVLSSAVPDTGDESHIALWTALLVLSLLAVAITGILYARRKRK